MENKDFEPELVRFLKVGIRQYQAKSFNLDFVQKQGFTVANLLTYSYHPDNQVSFRAAWLLEHICLQQPALIVPLYNTFLTELSKQKHWGTIRSYTKIAMLATDLKTAIPQTHVQEKILVEQAFNWLIDPKCPVAILVNCLDILCNLRTNNPWITAELKEQIHHLLKKPTPALASRAKRVLKKID